MSGQISSEEEYYRRREETVAYYNQMLSNYSELYQLNVSEDISIADEAWSTGFSNMVSNADTWSSSMTEYINGIDEQFGIWKTTIETIESSTGLSESGIQAKVGEIKTATDNLLKSLLGEDGESGLVGGLEQVADTIKN
jgi:methyl-accepting chemotaxis protein